MLGPTSSTPKGISRPEVDSRATSPAWRAILQVSLIVGSGVGYRYVKFTVSDLEVTAGNFFEQFGQGLIFRSYEERYLGVDNAMDGFRLEVQAVSRSVPQDRARATTLRLQQRSR